MKPIVYWIKCDRDSKPLRYPFVDLYDMLRSLEQLMARSGPIEFMVRES